MAKAGSKRRIIDDGEPRLSGIDILVEAVRPRLGSARGRQAATGVKIARKAVGKTLPDDFMRAQALISRVPLLPEADRKSALREALEAVGVIADKPFRVKCIIALAPLLPEAELKAFLLTDDFGRLDVAQETSGAIVPVTSPPEKIEDQPDASGQAVGYVSDAKQFTSARAEATQRAPRALTDRERAAFLAQAAAHPWDSESGVPASTHIRETFKRWLMRPGLRRNDIEQAQGNLLRAYDVEVSRYPERKVEGLYVQPHKLPPGAKPAFWNRPVWNLTEKELEAKRAMERERKQRQRLRQKEGALQL